MHDGAYEFTAEQEQSIEKLAQSMGFVGSFMIFLALLGVLGTAFMVYQLLPLLEHPEISADFLRAVVLPLLVPAINVFILLIFGAIMHCDSSGFLPSGRHREEKAEHKQQDGGRASHDRSPRKDPGGISEHSFRAKEVWESKR